MTGLTEEGFDDSFALVGHAQSFAGEEFGKALPCFLIRVSHGLIEWLNLSPNLLRVKLIETKLRYARVLFLLGIKKNKKYEEGCP